MGLLEPFFYHPLIVFFAIKGYISFLTQRQHEWGAMTRKGFAQPETKIETNS